jgi:hypothetical protein
VGSYTNFLMEGEIMKRNIKTILLSVIIFILFSAFSGTTSAAATAVTSKAKTVSAQGKEKNKRLQMQSTGAVYPRLRLPPSKMR